MKFIPPTNRKSQQRGSLGIDRRKFLRAGSAALAGGVGLGGGLGAAYSADLYQPDESCLGVASYSRGTISSAVARTTAGRIRGLYNGRAHVFKGIPYAAPTSGERRFMAPQKPAAWTGVRDTVKFGDQSPQLAQNIMAEELISGDNSPQGEDCLRLNIWTSGLHDGGKRPVMVWFHGGGWSGWSAGDPRYDGTNLASKQGVVIVTVNQRLNAFGFLYLADIGGDKYADSGNAGLLDLIAALQWVRDNIQEFGGDPDNVTIFGQSGGGRKVTMLMATPAAKGLFHRAIAESGLEMEAVEAKAASETTKRVMDRLRLKASQLDELQRLPVNRILAAMSGINHAPPDARGAPLNFGPVIDHRTVFNRPWDPVAPYVSRDVPLILGSNLTEVCFSLATPRDPIDEQELLDLVQHRLELDHGRPPRLNPEEAGRLIALYRHGYPDVSNVRLYQIMASDSWKTVPVAMTAERKASLQGAPVYVYHFEWITPVEGGRLGAPHTIEIPFVFDNLDVPTSGIVTGSGKDRYPLADRMSRAWTAFARTGNPNVPNLPQWSPYSADQRAVMIFNSECRLEVNPHAAEREAIAKLYTTHISAPSA